MLILFSLIDDSITDHGGHSFVLPATACAAHAALAGRALLCACAADRDNFLYGANLFSHCMRA